MSDELIRIMSRRRQFARPGGSHDRLVAFLAKALPAGIGLIAAVMVLAPLSPRGEVSFLLDRNKVAVTRERIAVNDARYSGKDNRNRAFSVTAGSAVQRSAQIPQVAMENLVAQIALNDGPANIRAGRGVYDYNTEQMTVDGPVQFDAADGYRMTTNNVAIDIKRQRAVGGGGVAGTLPSGTFTAQRITADLENRTVVLEGGARLHMTPGKMRIPK